MVKITIIVEDGDNELIRKYSDNLADWDAVIEDMIDSLENLHD